MKVGILCASASRRAGGVFPALSALCTHIHNNDCEIELFAGWDADFSQDHIFWSGIPVHTFKHRGLASFGYLPKLRAALWDASLDVIHTHGIWLYPSYAALHTGRGGKTPWIVSPHGMLDSWALTNSAWKKRISGLFYENAHLRGAACLHALCDAEAAAIRDYGLGNPIAVIPNGVGLPQLPDIPPLPTWNRNLPEDARILLFLGRIHPKKGLANLLQAWAKESTSPTDRPWHLVVAGWDQGGHQAWLERLMVSLGIANTVHMIGPKFGRDKEACLLCADAFVLPSVSEGLPMAVLEAWAYQLPVLMTPQCNLPEGFEAGAAVAIDPDVESIREGLRTLFGMNLEQRKYMGLQGRLLVEKRFTWPAIAQQMFNVYSWVLGQSSCPTCILDIA